MAEFSVDWLALREGADRAARSRALVVRLASALPAERPLRVLDLATGTGSNVRALADLLPTPQRWLLVDHDPNLLAALPAAMAAWAVAGGGEAHGEAGGLELDGQGFSAFIETRRLNLSPIEDERVFASRDLVTASALLDLVSERFLYHLAGLCRHHGTAVLFALSYDGRIALTPSDPDDELVRTLVNEHQLTDKGFGPALGPGAISAAEICFASQGYRTVRERRDWVLTPDRAELQVQLIEGWADAASTIAGADAPRIRLWRRRRLAEASSASLTVVVGHDDLAGWLPPPLRGGADSS